MDNIPDWAAIILIPLLWGTVAYRTFIKDKDNE